MKNSDCIRTLFLPFKYSKYECKNYKLAFGIFCVIYILSFICTVFAVKQFASETCDNIIEIISNSDNFYMSGSVFHYEGEKYERSIDNIGLNIVIDPINNPPETSDSSVLYIGPDTVAIISDLFTYSVSYAQLKKDFSDINFDKQFVVDQFAYGRTIVFNLIGSTSVLLSVLLVICMLIIILIVSLIISALCWFFRITLDFEKKLFISIGSMIYPIIINGIISVMPTGLSLVFGSFSIMARMYALLVLIYVFLALVPLKSNIQKNAE